ncbi:MAG: hypothetical protein L0271_02150 [Gemmatimonadetes bacterium]|nr:hypothetical protein [Gemmatimonadota bacterium]
MFLTNHHGLGASTVAAIYKERWCHPFPIMFRSSKCQNHRTGILSASIFRIVLQRSVPPVG